MNCIKCHCLIVAAAVALACWFVSPALAQSSEVEELGKRVIELYQAGKYADAVPLAQRVLAIREKALGPDHPDVAQSLNNLALLYDDEGRYADAEPLYKRSLAIYEKARGPDHPDVATALDNLALLYEHQGHYADAEPQPLHKRALAIREKALGPDHPDVARSLHPDVAGLLNNLASLYDHEGRYAEALPLVRRTIAGELSGPWVALPVLSGAQAAKLIPLDEAFDDSLNVVQRASHTLAGKALNDLAVRFSAGHDRLAQLVRKDQDLAIEATSLDKAILAAVAKEPSRRDAAAEQKIRDRGAAVAQQRDDLGKVFSREFPDYAALSRPQPLTAKEIQSLLAEDEAVVVIELGAKSYVWVVTRSETDWKEIAVTAGQVSKMVSTLRSMLTDQPFDPKGAAGQRAETRQPSPGDVVQPGKIGGPAQGFDLAASYELYQMLFGHALDLLAEKHHLIFVPHGSLTALPFQLLVSKLPMANTTLRDAAWLIRDHAVSVLPSVTSLRALRETAKRSPAPLPFIGFGDPQIGRANGAEDGGNPCDKAAMTVALRNSTPAAPNVPMSEFMPDGRAIADVNWVRSQPRLPGTRCELEALKQAEGPDSTVFVGANATETRVKAMSASGELAQYRVVEFATHGVLPAVARGVSEAGLILTPPAHGTLEDDGFLTTSEIAALKLNADWVILSACDTAGGDTPGAETLSGLARAFFYAGARAALVSHWPVDDRAAARLTTGTLRLMRDNINRSRAEALRLSMLELLDDPDPEFANPRMWAAFSLIGDGGTIDAR